MAGTLTINGGSKWMPAGWVFDGVLELLAADLLAEHPEMSREILAARTSARGSLDLRPADAARLRALADACGRAREKLEKGGAAAFHRPDSFDAFLRHLDGLHAMLRADPRLSG